MRMILENMKHKPYMLPNSYVDEDCETPSIMFTPKKGQSCKKIPVKETNSVRIFKNSDGRKMINEYVKERKINQGSYGKVVLYWNVNYGTPYAIKTICKSRLYKLRVSQLETAMTNVIREVSILKTLEHPNVVALVEVINDPKSDYLYLVLEYLEGNTIGNSLENTGRIDETTARRYLRDLISGIMYLHSHNIVHGDIKPENLLLTRNGNVKIGDFSFSRALQDNNDKLYTCPGTFAFTAPECCSDSDVGYDGKAADAWAMGVTLYCMVVGCCPFFGHSVPETCHKIASSPLLLPEDLEPELKDLLRKLLCKDQMQRITIDGVAKHPWVSKEIGPLPTKISCTCRMNAAT